MDIEPTFTYVIDLEGRTSEDVLRECSKSLRREIRNGDELDLTVTIEDASVADRIYDDMVAHFDAQGEEHPFSRSYVRDLISALDAHCRIYVARTPDGEYLGGIIVLYSADLATFWHGGVRADYESISVNSLLHWRIITDILEDDDLEDIRGYDLFGANTRRLSKYKSKFSGDLVPYFTVESSGPEMTIAKKAYQLLP
jgi:lipid II:glycine glycyltransferase (peptidoglycan interpeptide bridge formation enzyme)